MTDHDFAHVWHPGTAARTLLLLHGTGGDEHDLVPLGRALDPTANLLGVRGQVSERGMPRFFRRFAEGVLDLDDARARAAALVTFWREAAERYAFDPAQVVAVGFSNGANFALATVLAHPGVLPSVAAIRAMPTLQPTPGTLSGTRILLAQGRHDPLVPPPMHAELEGQLRSAGADLTVAWAEAGHQLTTADVDAIRRWLA